MPAALPASGLVRTARLAAFAMLVSTSGIPAAMARNAEAVSTYRNPVIDENYPDPAVLRSSDGFVYVYATQGEHLGQTLNIQVTRSRDLVTWQRMGDALPSKPAWASKTQDFWAPHVSERGGRYYLYYSAKPDAALTDTKAGLCLAVAIANRPEGPFVDSGRPLQCGQGFVNIDPMAFDDPRTGRALLFWGSGFGPIKVRELAADRISFLPGSQAVDLVSVVPTDDPVNYRRLVEGAWVTHRDGWYYLFFSGDNCCGPKAHYGVMVARSRSAKGPYEVRPQPILTASARWIAPGHNSVIEDANGQSWLVYHAIDSRRSRSKPGDEVNSRRVMLIDPIRWTDGWPVIDGGRPSNRALPRPRFR